MRARALARLPAQRHAVTLITGSLITKDKLDEGISFISCTECFVAMSAFLQSNMNWLAVSGFFMRATQLKVSGWWLRQVVQ